MVQERDRSKTVVPRSQDFGPFILDWKDITDGMKILSSHRFKVEKILVDGSHDKLKA
jgi:hypothetical protein